MKQGLRILGILLTILVWAVILLTRAEGQQAADGNVAPLKWVEFKKDYFEKTPGVLLIGYGSPHAQKLLDELANSRHNLTRYQLMVILDKKNWKAIDKRWNPTGRRGETKDPYGRKKDKKRVWTYSSSLTTQHVVRIEKDNGIRAYPTTFVVGKSGKVVGRFEGVVPVDKILEALDRNQPLNGGGGGGTPPDHGREEVRGGEKTVLIHDPMILLSRADARVRRREPSVNEILKSRDPWNNAVVRRAIDEFLQSTTPQNRSGDWGWSEWGQAVNAQTVLTVKSPPDRGSRSRHQYLWEHRTACDSQEVGTIYEYIKRRLAGGKAARKASSGRSSQNNAPPFVRDGKR